jgi:hypothetical protein
MTWARVGRRLGGAFTMLGILITFWEEAPLLGVPILAAGVLLIIWTWKHK